MRALRPPAMEPAGSQADSLDAGGADGGADALRRERIRSVAEVLGRRPKRLWRLVERAVPLDANLWRAIPGNWVER
ncbi:MAG: hypothetical protein K6T26_08650 [Alicyclobacillus sp.]|nr:hypothetical protein [Alicyclobacillus sp.]